MPAPFHRTLRSIEADQSLRAWRIGLVALPLTAAWLAWFIAAEVRVLETSLQARIEVQQAAHPVEAAVAGRVMAATVQVGRMVAAGEVLFELDASAEALQLKEQQAQLNALAPRLDSLRREIALREQGQQEDQLAGSAALEAARRRHQEGVAAASFAREQARRMLEESSFGGVAQIEAARAQSEAVRLSAASDALAADARRIEADSRQRARGAEAQVQSLRSQMAALDGEAAGLRAGMDRLAWSIGQRQVRAPVAGRIAEAAVVGVGANVLPSQRLATVVPAGRLGAVADFAPAAALGRIQPGQGARLRLDGFPWVQHGSLGARVLRVGSEIRDGRVRVELVLDTDAAARTWLQHGLPGSVEITIEQASPLTLVLRSAGQWLKAPASATRVAEPRT